MTTIAATVFALASGSGRAGVAVLRLSGPEAGDALLRLSGRGTLPPARRAVRVELKDAKGEAIDRGLALWFPGPASFTGEDVVELHLHGGPAVIRAASEALLRLGLRPAGPGEFSKRAFLNGKLDLTEAEGLADLVAAETEAQRRQALRQMDGALGTLYEGWRRALVVSLARLEAEIDFPDEEDVPGESVAAIGPVLRATGGEIAAHLADDRRGERLREGIEIAILGPPNAGKSSLINVLSQREAAIVSAQAGTTRDVVELHLDLGGYPVVLADTAGLRDALDPVEAEGVRRARVRAESADLRLVVIEAGDSLTAETAALLSADAILVVNKIDLAAPLSVDAGAAAVYPVSAMTGEGLPALIDGLTAAVRTRLEAAGAAPAITRARHRAALEDCRAAIDRALAGIAPELVAEDVRLAARSLGRITGRVDVEDVLDVVFREFCIGK